MASQNDLRVTYRRGARVRLVSASEDGAAPAVVIADRGRAQATTVAAALKFGYWTDAGPAQAGDAEAVAAARKALGA